jgi:hypothetical protein
MKPDDAIRYLICELASAWNCADAPAFAVSIDCGFRLKRNNEP